MFRLQIYCTGLGWIEYKDSSYKTLEEAMEAESQLTQDSTKWVDPSLERQTRIIEG